MSFNFRPGGMPKSTPLTSVPLANQYADIRKPLEEPEALAIFVLFHFEHTMHTS
jgi:hypothetical protein